MHDICVYIHTLVLQISESSELSVPNTYVIIMMNLNIEHQPKLRSRCLLFQPLIFSEDASVPDNAESDLKRIVTCIHGILPSLSSINSLPSQPSSLDTNRAAIRISFLHDAAFRYDSHKSLLFDNITVMRGLIIMRRDEYPKKMTDFRWTFQRETEP